MIEFHVYPGGKKRIVTFSYDDGTAGDSRLTALMNRYGLKGTFHLNGKKKFQNMTAEQKAELQSRYEGHEVSCHTMHHGWLNTMPPQSVTEEILGNRKVLEPIFGYPVVGMSYPCSGVCCNNAVMTIARACGIVYSRTTRATGTFQMPEDFLAWHPTCHHNPTNHNKVMALCDTFISMLDSEWCTPLFYIWGHAHEYGDEAAWNQVEELMAHLAGKEQIWYATNLQIYNYVTAQSRLQISMDETVFYNPSDLSVWVERDNREILEIPAGKTVVYKK